MFILQIINCITSFLLLATVDLDDDSLYCDWLFILKRERVYQDGFFYQDTCKHYTGIISISSISKVSGYIKNEHESEHLPTKYGAVFMLFAWYNLGLY